MHTEGHMRLAPVTALVGISILAGPAFAQTEIPKSVADSVSGPLRDTQADFLAAAEAMPESQYSFVPAAGDFKGTRSFAEQVKHVACSNFGFFNEIEGKAPPAHCEKGGPAKAASKAELIAYLRDSFDYGNGVLATVTGRNALIRVEGPYAGPNTRLGIAVTAVWHIADHYGQLIEYLRMNRIVPPATQRYPLAVR